MSEPDPIKRCAILGTAPTWKVTPWDDPGLEIWCLNDMYVMKPPRADRWYDLHPFEKFYFRRVDERLKAEDVPAGYFIRPEGHVEWLAQQSIPVILQAAQPAVPRGIVFPREAIVQRFGRWFDSTPAWMLAHALMDGYKEIHIYGIHLATEWEYQKQKPNLSFLCGVAVGMGVTLVIPPGSPLLRPTHQYAYEPDPSIPVMEAQRAVLKLQHEREVVAKALQASKRWYRLGADPVLSTRAAWLDAQLLDAKLGVDWTMAQKRAAEGN